MGSQSASAIRIRNPHPQSASAIRTPLPVKSTMPKICSCKWGLLLKYLWKLSNGISLYTKPFNYYSIECNANKNLIFTNNLTWQYRISIHELVVRARELASVARLVGVLHRNRRFDSSYKSFLPI